MTLDEAEFLAEALCDTVAPYCERVQVAGSIRRRKGTVTDIDIVLVPRQTVLPDLFGGPGERTCELHAFAKDGLKTADFDLVWIKPNSEDRTPHRIVPLGSGKDGKEGRRWVGWCRVPHWCRSATAYWHAQCWERQRGVKVEFWLTDADRFGATLLIRTGHPLYSQSVVTHARRVGMAFDEGELLGRDGKPLSVPEEEDVYRALSLRYVDPMDRYDERQVKGKVWS